MRTSKSTKAVMRYDHLKGRKKTPSAATWISPKGTREIRWRRAPLGSGIDRGLATEAMQRYSCAGMPRLWFVRAKVERAQRQKLHIQFTGRCCGGQGSGKSGVTRRHTVRSFRLLCETVG